jgi:hypothetical protein
VHDGDDGWRIEARLSEASIGRLDEFLVDRAAATPEAPGGGAA